MMKKIFLIMVAVLVYLPLTGFTSVDYSSVYQTSDGKYQENIVIKMTEDTVAQLEISGDEYISFLNNVASSLETALVQNYAGQVRNDTTLTDVQKQSILENVSIGVSVESASLQVTIKYSNTDNWSYFCDIKNSSKTELEYSFFTIDKKTTMTPKASKVTTSDGKVLTAEACFDFLKNKAIELYGEDIAENALAVPVYSYTYVATKHRIHSNADEQVYFMGLYQHTWKDIDNNAQEIIVYTTHANTTTWYLLAVGITLVFGAVVVVIHYTRKNKNIKNSIQEVTESDEN